MTDIGASGGPLHQLRTALSRILIDFQSDLKALDAVGLKPHVCQDVKDTLRDSIAAFEGLSTKQESVPVEIAKHFKKYAAIYSDWNGHEGDDPGKQALRSREFELLKEQRRALFRKLSKRQYELHKSGQLDLPFVESVKTPLAKLATKHPDRFPRLRQATVLFG
jgi:hypothetical protein